MLYRFPNNTFATAVRPYTRPYENPLQVSAGDAVAVDRSRKTDMIGWTWCQASDGRGGWVPDAWFDDNGAQWVARYDYSALELTVAPGDRFELLMSESGFILCRSEIGNVGWVPDAVLTLEASA